MMMAPVTSLDFAVQRRKPELIAPGKPTPREMKKLSDIDDQESCRYLLDVVYFYGSNPSMHGRDPVGVLREALACALVFYYPFAGRLREGPGRKLHVDCTGEGIVFVEADADVELKQFGDPPRPPFPCFEELLHRLHGSQNIIDTPLFHFQVTRLKCKGFIVAFRYNHTITDGFGVYQFWKAVGELAGGATVPTVLPVWGREVFYARDDPHVTCTHLEFDKNTGQVHHFENHDDLVVERSFFFGASHMSALRTLVPQCLSHATDFEIITACLWLCRVRALEIDSHDQVRLNFTVNTHGRWFKPPLPEGYYGNALAVPAAVTTAGLLSLEHALELVREAKMVVTGEYMQSTADLLATRGRPYLSMDGADCLFVSDTCRIGAVDDEVDYGWGQYVFAGPPGTEGGLFSYIMLIKNSDGEIGRLVTCGFPARAMDWFVEGLDCRVRPKLTSRL